MPTTGFSIAEMLDAWALLSEEDRRAGFELLSRTDGEELFDSLDSHYQAELLLSLPAAQRRSWLRHLAPDDAADLIQITDPDKRDTLLELLDETARKEMTALLAYEEDEAGGLMNPRYARLRPEMSVDAAISYLRRQTRQKVESIYYAYVLSPDQKLLGVVSLRELFAAPPNALVRDVMRTDIVTAPEEMDQEELSRLFAEHDLLAMPVVDQEGRMKGVVTVDDIVDVVQEEATEDIQKIGGAEALGAPYLDVHLGMMLRKRVGWLALLLVLEFAAVFALKSFEAKLEAAHVLAILLPLIISCGGNSGSQASTLIVRAFALDEVGLADWWRVVRRELLVGLTLGATLGLLSLLIVGLAHGGAQLISLQPPFGEHGLRLGVTTFLSIIAVAAWGTLVGSTLPFALRKLGFDPASASAPFVATILDATGIVIYFTVASFTLAGVLL